MPTQLGPFSFDDEIVIGQLQNDLRDDWFPDPLGYADLTRGGLITERIRANFSSNDGSYKASKATLFNVPKSNFTLRYALETSVSDRAVYHGLVSYLVPFYDPLISRRAFSHRYHNLDPGENERRARRYLFRFGVDAWKDFLGCVRASVRLDCVLLSTDLANYFENIDLEKLRLTLTNSIPELEACSGQKAQIRSHIAQLFECLANWSFSSQRGLPQNRDASSFLANIYMRSVDKFMIDKGYEYFRYMDDIKIVCANAHAARRALKDLSLSLREIGQVVNSGKTQIVLASDADAIARCLDVGNIQMRRIASAWQSKSLNPILRSLLPLKNLTRSVMDKNRYDTREFRFCVGRLESPARCKEFAVPDAYFDDLTPGFIGGLDDAPSATDIICKYLRAVKLKRKHLQSIERHVCDPMRSIYNWQNYRLWQLLAQKDYRSEKALDTARRTVADRLDDATRAGASVYLGAMGSKDDRVLVAQHFHELTSFLGQRSALIAVHELHYRGKKDDDVSIESHVRKYIRDDLSGCYRVLKRGGTYFVPLEPMSILRFVDLERDYD